MANSALLGIPLLATSQAAKETTINTMVSYLERAMNDTITVPLAGGNYTITATDLQRYFMWQFTGAGGTSEITISPMKRLFAIDNLANGSDLTLKCGAATLTIPANGVVTVMATATPTLVSVTDSTVMGGGGGVSAFTGLSDTFASYTGKANHVLRIKNDLTGIESVALGISHLADVDVSPLADGDVLVWDESAGKFVATALDAGGGSSGSAVSTTVRITLTANLDTGAFIPGDTLDGIATAENDRVLLTAQTDALQNGIYVVTATGIERASDMAASDEPDQGLIVFSREGDIYGNTIWILESDDNSIGSSVLEFTQPRAGSFASLTDYDTSVVPTANMVLVYDDVTQKWKPTITSTSLPAGGTAGQALVKNSSTDYDWTFQTLVPEGGTTGQFLVKSSNDDFETEWVDPPTSSTSVREFVGTTDTALLADAGNIIAGNNAAAITATIPPNSSVAYPVGTTLTWWNKGAGLITIAPGSGVTLNESPGLTLTAYGQHSMIAALKVDADTWVASGNFGVDP